VSAGGGGEGRVCQESKHGRGMPRAEQNWIPLLAARPLARGATDADAALTGLITTTGAVDISRGEWSPSTSSWRRRRSPFLRATPVVVVRGLGAVPSYVGNPSSRSTGGATAGADANDHLARAGHFEGANTDAV
jgi:hypothetical protein